MAVETGVMPEISGMTNSTWIRPASSPLSALPSRIEMVIEFWDPT